MHTATVETDCSRTILQQLESGGLFKKFDAKSNPEQKPLLGEYEFMERLLGTGDSDDATSTLLKIDEANVVIKILGHSVDYTRGLLKIHFDFLPGCSKLQQDYVKNPSHYRFVLRYLNIEYRYFKSRNVITVDMERVH